jgi:preprotein translocase subunit SecG
MLIYYLITALHVIVCVILILVVLLQSGKGADLAGAFGGGATQTAFGSRGPASFLSKMTTVAAIVFMVTSISLSTITRRAESKSILETTGAKSRPAPKAPVAQTPVQAPSKEEIARQLEEAQKKQQQQQPAVPMIKVEQGTTTSTPIVVPSRGSGKPGEAKPPSKP